MNIKLCVGKSPSIVEHIVGRTVVVEIVDVPCCEQCNINEWKGKFIFLLIVVFYFLNLLKEETARCTNNTQQYREEQWG